MDSRKKKRTLTINAGEGGTTNPKGTMEYQVEKPISITATPESEYEFTGWTIIGGDVTIENPGSSTTTATLHGSNSTIIANFKQSIEVSQLIWIDFTAQLQVRTVVKVMNI